MTGRLEGKVAIVTGAGSGVASGMLLGAIGTDTGGSIRIPAAFCGVSGLMPTYGRVPKSGCTPLGFSSGLGGALAGRPFAIRFVDKRSAS